MKRIHTLDSLKFFAICAVFVIHFWVFYLFQGVAENSFYLGFNIVARFAVPVFFIVAGYLFFQRTQDKPLVAYTKAYLAKLFVMYLVWTFIYHMIYGLSYDVWSPISFATVFYYGTAGFVTLWFLPALFFSILVLMIAVKFNRTGTLFIIATLLHLVGLSNQSYQPLLPESLHVLNTYFRDPAFFGLFYVTLGYQLLKAQWVDKLLSISKNSLIWLVIALVSALLMLIEGLYLTQQLGATVGEYYLFTPILTVAMLMVALTVRSNEESSSFSKLGVHSGEIYLNHGVLMLLYGPLVAALGYRSTPENITIIANSVTYQLLLVPTMLAVCYSLYFLIGKGVTLLSSAKVIKKHKDLVMFTGGYWMFFFAANLAQGGSRFDSTSNMVVGSAFLVYIAFYLFTVLLISKPIDRCIALYKRSLCTAMVLATFWISFAKFGGFEWLANQTSQEGSPLAELVTGPLICFIIFYLLATTCSLWCLGKIEKIKSH
ncbi:hypothetical protein GCM10007916_29360 [Psychromonas marina]|uniref:Acyltransferase 3 domain-containing protein n=1 Tax=Psychromonas marina TaxID=88364 RepID=A0ABQ6E3F1_9GAMM|nr:acyltransferase [Psychromonas marina]GLS91866.1 hypothetical protein GCM10007916_29360 [Psychromonas marina]